MTINATAAMTVLVSHIYHHKKIILCFWSLLFKQNFMNYKVNDEAGTLLVLNRTYVRPKKRTFDLFNKFDYTKNTGPSALKALAISTLFGYLFLYNICLSSSSNADSII